MQFINFGRSTAFHCKIYYNLFTILLLKNILGSYIWACNFFCGKVFNYTFILINKHIAIQVIYFFLIEHL